MKKIKLVVAAITAMFVLAIATTVNAYTNRKATITYGDVNNGKVDVTAVFDIDMTHNAKNAFQNQGFTVKDSKTLTINMEQGANKCGSYVENDGDMFIVEITETPFELEVGESIRFKNVVGSLQSSNPEVMKVNSDNTVTAVKPGTANITGKQQIVTTTYDVNYKGTVVNSNGGVESTETTPTETTPTETTPTETKPTETTPTETKPTETTPTETKPTENPATGDKTDSFKWIDKSKATATAVSEKFNNINVNTNIKPNDDALYYVYFSKKADENISLDSIKDSKSKFSLYKDTKTGILSGRYSTHINELSGDTYLYIIEKCTKYKDANFEKENVIIKGQKVEKAKLPGYGKRLDIYVYNSKENSAFSNVGTTDTRKLNYKIGKISSDDILRTFKNEDSNVAFKKLYDYAKDAKILKEGTEKMGDSTPNIVSDIKLEDGAYYFIYLNLDTENGKYETVDDVAIYRAIVNEEGNSMVHFAFNTINVADKDDKDTSATDKKDEQPKDKNEENKNDKEDDSGANTDLPQTGATSTFAIIVTATIAVGAVGFVGYRKYNGIK